MSTALAPNQTLTQSDRCDRCGAQAYVRVVLTAGGELLFCSHHFAEHAHTLRPKASHIQDETHRLSPAASAPEA
jgi:hypothetical protein